MMDVRHEFEGSIRSNSQDCLADNAGCVESFVVEDEYGALLSFITTVRGIHEDVSVEYTVVPVDQMVTGGDYPME